MNKQQLIESIKKTSLFKWYRQKFYEVKSTDYDRPILDDLSTSEYIKRLLLDDAPVMVSRLGSTELKILERTFKKRDYPERLRNSITNVAGVFPNDDRSLQAFSELYFEKIGDIDLLGVWFNPFEDVVANLHCPNARLTKLRNLEPYFSERPWSYYLKGKKVLVINLFASSIGMQYKKREKLFKNIDVLPEFDLITYKPVQSFGGVSDFASWFDALEFMQNEIAKIDFDVAIIGAGAYGLPLASYIKRMGKKSLHLGGATQMLFGVYGRRWEQMPEFQDIINEHWIRPQLDEKPKNANNVENACYW